MYSFKNKELKTTQQENTSLNENNDCKILADTFLCQQEH